VKTKTSAFFESLRKFEKLLRDENIENISIVAFITDHYLKKAIEFYLKSTGKQGIINEIAFHNTEKILEKRYDGRLTKVLKAKRENLDLEGVFATAVVVYITELAELN